MHFHNISYQDYISIQKFFRKAIKDLDSQIDKGIVIEDTKSNTSVLAGCLTFLVAFIAKMSVLNELRSVFEANAKVQEQISTNASKIREQQRILQEQLKTVSIPTLKINEEFTKLVKSYNSITIPTLQTGEIKAMSDNLRKIALTTIGDKKNGE